MVAVDTNVLVYAFDGTSPHHSRALETVEGLATGSIAWAIPWPCVHEFLSVMTHPRIYGAPMSSATGFLDQLRRSPNLKFLCESEGYWEHLLTVVAGGGIQGPKIHDARIAALCLHHGVTMLLSADRDFRGFAGLRVLNPFGTP